MLFADTLLEQIQKEKQTFVLDLENLNTVKANLKFLHDACVASERLLREAYVSASRWKERDSFIKRLAEYYDTHLEEERGEISLLEKDLEYAGVSLGWIPDPIAMAMIGTQYYMLKHAHPVSLLGYMAVVEADPTPLSVVERLENLYGKELFRFVRLHAIKDLDHRKELIEVINLTPETLRIFIYHSTKNVLGYLRRATSKWRMTMISS